MVIIHTNQLQIKSKLYNAIICYGFYRPTFVLIDKRGRVVGYAVYKSV